MRLADLIRHAARCGPLRRLAATVALACVAGSALADPGYYVVTVYDDPGVATVDFRYWTVKPRGSELVTWPEIGFGWNVGGRWYSEIIASYVGPTTDTYLNEIEWQNDFLLTHGQLPVDLAIHTLAIVPQDGYPGYAFEYGPVVQTDIGRTQVNLNLVFERGLGARASQPTQLKYQWQLRYRWMRGLHVGAQGFGELGNWHDWLPASAQSHRAGPALFGSIGVGPGKVSWQAAYLVGKTFGYRGGMFTARLKYDY